jgi:hypothetical protein
LLRAAFAKAVPNPATKGIGAAASDFLPGSKAVIVRLAPDTSFVRGMGAPLPGDFTLTRVPRPKPVRSIEVACIFFTEFYTYRMAFSIFGSLILLKSAYYNSV